MKKNLIIGIISLMIIVAAVGGCLFVFDKIDKSIDGDETTKASGTTVAPDTSPDVSVDSDSQTTPTDSSTPGIVYGSDLTIGYSTVGDYTYFFYFYDNDGSKGVFWKANCDGDNHDIKQFGDYELYIASSFDALEWTLDEYGFHDFGIPSGNRLFVSYTRIYNCTNPGYVLEDLKQNVFSNENYFSYRVDSQAG